MVPSHRSLAHIVAGCTERLILHNPHLVNYLPKSNISMPAWLWFYVTSCETWAYLLRQRRQKPASPQPIGVQLVHLTMFRNVKSPKQYNGESFEQSSSQVMKWKAWKCEPSLHSPSAKTWAATKLPPATTPKEQSITSAFDGAHFASTNDVNAVWRIITSKLCCFPEVVPLLVDPCVILFTFVGPANTCFKICLI